MLYIPHRVQLGYARVEPQRQCLSSRRVEESKIMYRYTYRCISIYMYVYILYIFLPG